MLDHLLPAELARRWRNNVQTLANFHSRTAAKTNKQEHHVISRNDHRPGWPEA